MVGSRQGLGIGSLQEDEYMLIHGHICGCNRNQSLPEEEGRSRYGKRRKTRINPLVLDSS